MGTNKKTKRLRTNKQKIPILSEDQEYNIYIICKNKQIFKDKVSTLERYNHKINKSYYVPAVFLKDTPKNRKLTQKLHTRHNTHMTKRLRKLGCIYAHRKALKQIVANKTDNNLILEEDATLDHVLPNPPKKSSYLGGWIVPPQITLAGKQKIKIPNLKSGLNEINFDSFQVLMAHAYYMKTHEFAKEILESIEKPGKIKNYDVHLMDHRFLKQFYYPAIFVQGKHISDIEGVISRNDLRTHNYGLDLT